FSQASALRLEITTRAPARANSSAMDLPMPLVEPVMTATLPVRSKRELMCGSSGMVVQTIVLYRCGSALLQKTDCRNAAGTPDGPGAMARSTRPGYDRYW